MYVFTGLVLALFEVSFIFLVSYLIRTNSNQIKELNPVLYYWTFFTFFTGIWEFCFLIQYSKTCYTALEMLDNNTHVWSTYYKLNNVLPWKFSNIFYAEYGAYADREYMLVNDDWSRVIEGSHAVMCGVFAGSAILLKLKNKYIHYIVFISVCMGSQLMNSILYMINYFHQTHDKTNVNYITDSFPAGTYLEKRPFMYINIFWTIMPLFCIINLINNYNKILYYDEQYKLLQ